MLAAHHAEGGGAALADADHVQLPEAAPEVELILDRPGRQVHDQRASGTIIVHLEAAGVAFLARDAALPQAGARHDPQKAQGVASPVSTEPRVDRPGDAEGLEDVVRNTLELEGISTGNQAQRTGSHWAAGRRQRRTTRRTTAGRYADEIDRLVIVVEPEVILHGERRQIHDQRAAGAIAVDLESAEIIFQAGDTLASSVSIRKEGRGIDVEKAAISAGGSDESARRSPVGVIKVLIDSLNRR